MKLSRFLISCTTIAMLCATMAVSVWAGEVVPYEPNTLECAAESLLEPCGLSAEELQAGLCYELVQYAGDFLQAETDTGVNAVFLCAVSGLESGWGRYCANDNNLFGWTDGSGYMAFNSPEDCISYVAQNIKDNYLSLDGCYYNGVTVEAVNIYYNGTEFWEQEVKNIMLDIMDGA